MQSVELKKSIFSLLDTVKDEESLCDLKTIIGNYIGGRQKEKDFAPEMSQEEIKGLEEAILEAQNSDNLITHEEVMKS